METWILSWLHASPLRNAGASRKTGTSGDGFRIMPRRMLVAVGVAEQRRRSRDRRPMRTDGIVGLQKAILLTVAGKVVLYIIREEQ